MTARMGKIPSENPIYVKICSRVPVNTKSAGKLYRFWNVAAEMVKKLIFRYQVLQSNLDS
jgi:hypothetical protein